MTAVDDKTAWWEPTTTAAPVAAARPVPAAPLVTRTPPPVRARREPWRPSTTTLVVLPLLVIAVPAYVAIWSGWVGLGQLTGFGPIHPLPGTAWAGWVLDTSITLPIGMEAYASYAVGVALWPTLPARARRFAAITATTSLAMGMGGQVAYHLMTAAHYVAAPWWITVVVSCLPVAVVGQAAVLTHLILAPTPTAPTPAAPTQAPAPAAPAQAAPTPAAPTPAPTPGGVRTPAPAPTPPTPAPTPTPAATTAPTTRPAPTRAPAGGRRHWTASEVDDAIRNAVTAGQGRKPILATLRATHGTDAPPEQLVRDRITALRTGATP